MDYEKAYNEALLKAKSFIERWDGVQVKDSVRNELKKIFPELKESEDERIRKAIISIVAFSPEAMFDRVLVSRKDALAWLEKQGEKKSAEWREEDTEGGER